MGQMEVCAPVKITNLSDEEVAKVFPPERGYRLLPPPSKEEMATKYHPDAQLEHGLFAFSVFEPGKWTILPRVALV